MKKDRFPEIDLVRGLAVVYMVVYHAIFDLHTVGLLEIQIQSLPLEIFQEVTAGTFFLIVGISLYISFSRTKSGNHEPAYRLKKYTIRGVKLVGWGGIITAVSYFLFPEFLILFGALHFIGVSVLFGYAMLELTYDWDKFFRLTMFISMAVAVFLVSGPVRGIQVNNPFLLWLGLTPPGFQSLDYFPILPWFCFVVSGLIIGELLYPAGTRSRDFYNIGFSPLETLGRHALVIYFFHQPIIYTSALLATYILSPNNVGFIQHFGL